MRHEWILLIFAALKSFRWELQYDLFQFLLYD